MNLLENKVAIITGGTRGIGFEIVRKFLQNGAKVALCGSRQESADAAVEKLKAENPDWEMIGIAPVHRSRFCRRRIRQSEGTVGPHRHPGQ